ncbi:riboflavin biosynthesis protein RibF [Aquirhabdus parva]|uniref:Riboflavin biosynthesis protein n=1 Tax=Aquirhabdus parva TaxID=2283318 RepID=A0A345P349_9GAMM|nr:riboflavin biosynthesis protein RibF [Aquirhabdus parva]
MKLLRLHSLPHDCVLPPLAVTIGNFDGVHLGHQAMIQTLKDTAKELGLKTLVMLFEPQPQEFFRGEEAPARITSWREKVEILKSLDVDYVLLVRFDQSFRSLTAQAFADLLKNRLNARELVIGDDFRFGCDRAGDVAFLKDYGFPVAVLPTILVDGARVSSTRIRELLASGDFVAAARLLGRPYRITGRVQYGDQIGRTIDFPTANVALNRLTPCLHGIYAVQMELADGTSLFDLTGGQAIPAYAAGSVFGAGHVGTRPAIKDQSKKTWRLEVFLPHTAHPEKLSVDLYGLRVSVTFLHFLHGELNYPSLEALQTGIQSDVKQLMDYRQSNRVFPIEITDLHVVVDDADIEKINIEKMVLK